MQNSTSAKSQLQAWTQVDDTEKQTNVLTLQWQRGVAVKYYPTGYSVLTESLSLSIQQTPASKVSQPFDFNPWLLDFSEMGIRQF